MELHCTDALALLAGLEPESVNLAFLDPPYFRVAAQMLGRRFVGGDIQEHWVEATRARLKEARGEMRTPVKRPVEPPAPKGQLDIFEMMERGLE